MDLSIIDAAPERARSAKKRPLYSSFGCHPLNGLRTFHRWLSADDDLITYCLCMLCFIAGIGLALHAGPEGFTPVTTLGVRNA